MADNNGTILYDSIMDCGEVYVPAEGLIEIAGNVGDVFKVNLSSIS